MQPPATPIPPRAEYHRCRQLIIGAYRRIAEAQDLIAYSRQAIASQRFFRIVCAWCQRPMGWEHCDESDHGQVSHGICDACSMRMFAVPQTHLPTPSTVEADGRVTRCYITQPRPHPPAITSTSSWGIE